MVSEQPTRKVIKTLTDAGWRPVRTVGSHTTWQGPNGTRFPLPDGHKAISPGVYRKLLKAMKEDER
ncbi:type II toxin-antitoxin system HicA family toxin [Microbacterium sp. KNMS]